MTNQRKKLMTTVIAGSMAASIVIGGGTFAYLQSQTDDVVNEFKTEQVKVEISESPHDPYDIIPGTEQDKDPSVTVKNTVEAFVFLNVTDNTYGLVTYEIDDTWKKLDGYENVYYKKVPAAADANGTTLKVLKDDKVSYDKDLINEDMLDENGDLRTDVALSFNAFAIQARPFTDQTDPEDPTTAPPEAEAAAAAYNQAAPISTQEELNNALTNAAEGDTIMISEGTFTLPSDMPNVRLVGVSPEKTIIDAGNIFGKTTTIDISNVTFKKPEGANRVLKFKGEGKFKNCVFDNENGIAVYEAVATGDTTFEDCTFKARSYACNYSTITGTLTFKNCDFTGWNSFGKQGNVVIDGCTFHKSDSYGVVRFYQDAEIKNSTFAAEFADPDDEDAFIDANNSDITIKIDNCTGINNDKLYDNTNYPTGYEPDNITWIVDGTTLPRRATH